MLARNAQKSGRETERERKERERCARIKKSEGSLRSTRHI